MLRSYICFVTPLLFLSETSVAHLGGSGTSTSHPLFIAQLIPLQISVAQVPVLLYVSLSWELNKQNGSSLSQSQQPADSSLSVSFLSLNIFAFIIEKKKLEKESRMLLLAHYFFCCLVLQASEGIITVLCQASEDLPQEKGITTFRNYIFFSFCSSTVFSHGVS